LTEREHTGKKIVDCQIIGPAAAGSAGYVASPMVVRGLLSTPPPGKRHSYRHEMFNTVAIVVGSWDEIVE